MIALALGGVGLYAALPTLLAFMTGVVALLGQTIAARKDPDITLAEYNELVQEATKLRKQMKESDEKRI